MKLHHIGLVVDNIERSAELHCARFGVEVLGPAVIDPLQKVRVQFLGRPGEQASFELIEPTTCDSPVMTALKRGGGLNHLCFEVDDVRAELDRARRQGAFIISPATPAIAFEKRLIAFLFYQEVGIVELLQAREDSPKHGA